MAKSTTKGATKAKKKPQGKAAAAKPNGNGKAAKSPGETAMELACKLSDAELIKRGKELASLNLEHERVKDRKAEAVKRFNGELDEIDTKAAALAKAVDTGEEHRLVTCKWIEDFPKKCMRLVRQDTGEEIDVRAMTKEELQGKLSGVLDAPPPKTPKPDTTSDHATA